ncbi:MAG: DUF2149 domain-containing protein [Phoenicibacter congonensis]|uniref:DUF2149 domain-containing protein n=1 Tax=Phoenicibacter congonensis TaxID=1944646 RepID=A0AA43RI70_9ACTN|nr:DUF2149 domain-containing protein [Phoenicibacter congonensis]
MIRRRNATFSSRNFSFEADDDVNPMETVANLSDVMLVFAVALMLAIVTHWGVDISSNLTTFDSEDMEAIDEAQTEDVIQNSTSGYEELGRAYKDPTTGEVYVIQDNSDSSSDSGN